MKYAALALAAAGAAHAQSSTGARFGLKGGNFDVNGFAANGLDVFGFDKNGKDAWGRPIDDVSAGLVAPVGKVNPPSSSSAPPPPSSSTQPPKPTTTKPHKPMKPTPTPFLTPTYTTVDGERMQVVESTVVFPLNTVTDTVIRTYSVDIRPTSAPIRPVESTRVSCYGGQVTIKLQNPCPTESNNFMAEMLMAEIAYVSQTSPSDWDILVNDGTSITVITCSKWAYNQLETTALAHPESLNMADFTPYEMIFCEPKDAPSDCDTVPLYCSNSGTYPVNGVCSGKRRAARDADCGTGFFNDNGYCSRCAHIPGCQEVSCSATGKSVCTKCHATLAVSSIGACN
eukprot:comp22101_c0_seq4/m.32258 comp22101_c0_seq4/g.32258  ORF comp22101_c0_seq4/g.32258 comp22101_c0_seq4/m.32258 type:complete len:342 (-) comp22101_c0_seq4:355-1380(-)